MPLLGHPGELAPLAGACVGFDQKERQAQGQAAHPAQQVKRHGSEGRRHGGAFVVRAERPLP
jgi:hypothetical protein